MKAFHHYNARSIDQALSLIKDHDGQARFIAGGTDLLGVLKDDILPRYPLAIINIKTIPGLDEIEEKKDGTITIGALSKLAHVAGSPVIQKHLPALVEAAQAVATPEIRNMGTIGGNLCQDTRCWYYRYPHQMGGRIQCFRKGKGPCLALKGDNRYHSIAGGKGCVAVCPSDTAIALVALDARIVIIGPQGEREIPIMDFYTNMGTILKPDEILKTIIIPPVLAESKQIFLKFTLRKPIDFAVVSVASLIKEEDGMCTDVRIALGAVAPTPVRAYSAEDMLRGNSIDTALAEEAAQQAVKGFKPLSMNAYKIEITKTLIKRSLVQ
ncbi:MAG: xanthine dehydrogenase family protein subunit M [Deltaproteobacteria bacterium]|nr:xanthine dehydrogenase family protein subunit M [Deltaproteobacteria bacterium]